MKRQRNEKNSNFRMAIRWSQKSPCWGPVSQPVIRISRIIRLELFETMETFVARHLHRSQSSMCSQVANALYKYTLNRLRRHIFACSFDGISFGFFVFVFFATVFALSESVHTVASSIGFSCMFNLISFVASFSRYKHNFLSNSFDGR